MEVKKKKMDWKKLYMETLVRLNEVLNTSEMPAEHKFAIMVIGVIMPIKISDETSLNSIDESSKIMNEIVQTERTIDYLSTKAMFDRLVKEANNFLQKN